VEDRGSEGRKLQGTGPIATNVTKDSELEYVFCLIAKVIESIKRNLIFVMDEEMEK
jgi:hypothetical protein